MKKIKITTPENIEVEYNLADIGSRSAAMIFDFLIQGIGIIILFIAIVLIFLFARNFWDVYYGWIIGVSMILLFIISMGYYIILELSMNGMTFGKKIMKIRVIRNNGEPVTFNHSALRNLFKVFVDMNGVGLVFMFFNKQNKRVGDMVASTVVVAENNNLRPISLEELNDTYKKLSYYLSPEENEIVRGYIQRRGTIQDANKIRNDLKGHLAHRFSELGILEEWRSFIKEL
jgi:uncharacterized RDD family membrane protein YckC